MVEAERGYSPISLAGVPYDDSYSVAALEDDKTTAQQPVGDETDQSVIGNTPVKADDNVNNVLNGMFDLFERTPVAAAKPAKKADKKQTLVLPKANVDAGRDKVKKRDIFRQIFGGIDDGAQSPSQADAPKKKKKKKYLLDSIF
jgi:hypothetical protein